LLAIKYPTCNRIQWLKLFNFCFDVIIPFDLEVEFSLGWKRLGFDFEVTICSRDSGSAVPSRKPSYLRRLMVCPVGWKSGESMISGAPPLPTARGPVGVLLLRRSALMCGGEANGGGDWSNSVVWFSHSGSRRQGVSSFHRRICLPVVETLQRRCDELGHGGSSPPVYIHHSATLKSSLLPFNVRLLSHLLVCLLRFDGIDCPWFCVLVLHSLYVARDKLLSPNYLLWMKILLMHLSWPSYPFVSFRV
ncbi:unnamed protein product, partial [Brassica oleracea var. botrytis]